MAGFLSKIFSKNKSSKEEEASRCQEDVYPTTLAGFIVREVRITPYIKPCAIELVIKHFNKEINLFDKTEDYINTLTDAGVQLYKNPKKVFDTLQLSARGKHTRFTEITKMKTVNITEFSYNCCNDERDCEWCKNMNEKILPIDTDITRLVEENCTCEYCRCIIMPKISW